MPCFSIVPDFRWCVCVCVCVCVSVAVGVGTKIISNQEGPATHTTINGSLHKTFKSFEFGNGSRMSEQKMVETSCKMC